MTEHIVSFSIGIDDDTIKRTIQDKAVESIKDDIKKDVLSKLFTRQYGYGSVITKNALEDIQLSKDAVLSSFATDIIVNVLDSYKSEIISLAADKLAESYKRTKAWKNAAEDAMKEKS